MEHHAVSWPAGLLLMTACTGPEAEDITITATGTGGTGDITITATATVGDGADSCKAKGSCR